MIVRRFWLLIKEEKASLEAAVMPFFVCLLVMSSASCLPVLGAIVDSETGRSGGGSWSSQTPGSAVQTTMVLADRSPVLDKARGFMLRRQFRTCVETRGQLAQVVNRCVASPSETCAVKIQQLLSRSKTAVASYNTIAAEATETVFRNTALPRRL